MSYVKGSQLPSTSTVADTDTLIVTQEGDSKATKKVAKSDLLKEDRTRLTNLETDNTTNKSNITNLQNDKAEKNHNHAISNITNLQTTLDSKMSKIYDNKIIGAISLDFKKQIVGTASNGGFVSSFRKDDSTDDCMPRYAAGLAWGQVDTHGMICVNYNNPTAYIAGGNINKLNWSKQLAFKDELDDLKKQLLEMQSALVETQYDSLINNN